MSGVAFWFTCVDDGVGMTASNTSFEGVLITIWSTARGAGSDDIIVLVSVVDELPHIIVIVLRNLSS
jgi:hypothetical protein